MAKKKNRDQCAVDSWEDYQKVIDCSPDAAFPDRVRNAYDELYAARVMAQSILGPDASEDAVLRVFDALVRREEFGRLGVMRGKSDKIR